MTGTPPPSQDLTLIRSPTSSVQLSPEHATLADFGAQNDMELNVVDRNPYSVLTLFQKPNEDVYYKMSDEDYDKIPGTVRAFKREKFQNDPEYRRQILEGQQKREQVCREELEQVAKMKIGDRCKVDKKTGTVKFLGPLEKRVGLYVGVELDQPVGNCAGACENIQYFTTQPGCGVFLKPHEVEIGNFEVDLGMDDSDEL